MANLTPAQMVEKYIMLRDHKKAAEKEFKESLVRVDEAMNKLEALMLDHLNTTGAKNLACDAGTVYINTLYSATVKDREAFLEFVKGSGLWDALDVRANKTFVKEYAAETAMVPGVELSAIKTVGVRRSQGG